ncbi:MAG: hypothetical protein DI539_00525 [Flavobacterium psychrophilum]|nr:MAG: hypothetical protein DI539_00525 [Flavobacterium psychrophilum]
MKKTLLAFMAMMSLGSYAQSPIEGFEDPWVSPGPNLLPAPPGWIVVNQYGPLYQWRQTQPGNVAEPPYGGSNHAAFLNKENVSPTDAIPKDWLISPIINPQVGSEVKFQSRLTIAGDQGGAYKVYAIPPDANVTAWDFENSAYLLGSYTELEMNPVQTEWTEKVIAIPQSLAGTLVRIALVVQGDDADRWLVDDFTVTNACYAPKNLNVTNITTTTATLGWTDENGATNWEVMVSPPDAEGPTGVGVVVNDNEYVITNLVAGAYKFYVRSVCGPEHMSAWSGPFNFSTDISYNNVLHGIVKYDWNDDGDCDLDGVVQNAAVAVSVNGVYAYTVYTNELGEYTIYSLPDGTNTLSLQVSSNMNFPDIPVLEQQVAFDEEINELTISHCLPALNPGNNMAVYIVPVVNAVPGFNAEYIVYMGNSGSAVNNDVNVTFTFDSDRLEYVSSEFPATISGNTLTIDAGDFNLWMYKSVALTFHVKEPPVNIGGEIVNFTAALSEIADDVFLDNNSYELSQMITNSFDPNDITVHEGVEIYEDQADDYLTYTIRFQNTGNGNAINIRLENTLDDLLDWDTFEPVKSSHSNAIKREGNQLEFFFAGINLPYESADEPGSHGYVTYRVKPKAEYGLGDMVSNTAEIYFDFNEAIVTNTATTEVVSSTVGLNDNALAIARVYPNPVKDQLHVEVAQGELQSVAVYDINGRLCLSAKSGIIDTNTLNSGIYLVKVTTDAGSANYKIIKH